MTWQTERLVSIVGVLLAVLVLDVVCYGGLTWAVVAIYQWGTR